MNHDKIILASQSPRRKQLLEWAEIKFDVIVSDADESYPDDLSFSEIAIHIAKNKANVIKKSQGDLLPILAADTIVVCNQKVIGKPKDRADAISIINELSGNTHEVITGVAILHQEKEILFSDITNVSFHTLTQEQIEFYVDHYKPYDKAGAYAIQEWIGVTGIEKIEGDYYNVMGLPIGTLLEELKQF